MMVFLCFFASCPRSTRLKNTFRKFVATKKNEDDHKKFP